MTKPLRNPARRRHFMMTDDDWTWLLHYCDDRAGEALTPSFIIRSVMHQFIELQREKAAPRRPRGRPRDRIQPPGMGYSDIKPNAGKKPRAAVYNH
jgi:hypothetical protein